MDNPLTQITWITRDCVSCGEVSNMALGENLCSLCEDELGDSDSE